MAEIVEINHVADLEAYRLTWNALLAATPGASFFQSLDWLAEYMRHFGGGQKLRVLVVRAGGETLGILPLVVCPETTRLGTVKVLTYPLHDWATFFGPLGPQPAATLLAGLQHIANTRRDWELLDLRFVDKDTCDRGRTPTALRAAGFGAWESPWKVAAVVEVQGTWEEYFADRTSKFRNNLRRFERRLTEVGAVTYERYRPLGSAHGDDNPRWQDYEAVLELARRSWQGSSHNGTTLSHASIEPFIRETHALAARQGMLDLNLLKLDGKILAFAYNYVYQGRVYGLRVGYDPEYAKQGVGNVLYWRALQDSFLRGDTFYDMGVGSLDIKRPWHTRLATSYRYTHYPLLAPRAGMLALKRWWSERRAAPAAATSPTADDSQPATSA